MDSISLNDYYTNLKLSGIRTKKGDGNYLWIKHESFSVIRFPEFITSVPVESEIKGVFSELNCLLISYCNASNEAQKGNAVIYNCCDQDYNHNNLSKNVIRDIKIGRKNLSISFVDWHEILEYGFKAFQDTRTRVGLSDGNKNNFENRFRNFSKNEGHKALAAKLNGEIVAFMSLIVVNNFVIIQGSFSTDEHRKLCPNNLLTDFLLNYFLKENNFDNVSYGLSSIQEDTSIEGLHNYKIRVGFDPINIQRVFLLHPYIAPFQEIISKFLKILLLVFPKHRLIRKASGLFQHLNKPEWKTLQKHM
jgi:hypothetical protein